MKEEVRATEVRRGGVCERSKQEKFSRSPPLASQADVLRFVTRCGEERVTSLKTSAWEANLRSAAMISQNENNTHHHNKESHL